MRADWNGNVDYWQEVQESDKGLIDSKTVAEVSDKAMETSLKLNGVEDGKRSYGRMVDLLLDWYFMQQEGAELKMKIVTRSAEQTIALGEKLGALLGGGEIIA